MGKKYRARVVDVDGGNVRLEPETDPPTFPAEVNLLSLSLAMALGAAGYQHHDEIRDDGTQTLEALLGGQTTMPWRHKDPDAPEGQERHVVCEQSESGAWKCHVDLGS